MSAGVTFDWHTHDDHQLAWSPDGVLFVLTHEHSYVLPPTRALWIPARTEHETRAFGVAILRSVYVKARRCPVKVGGSEACRGNPAAGGADLPSR
jgi:hypothetical protein